MEILRFLRYWHVYKFWLKYECSIAKLTSMFASFQILAAMQNFYSQRSRKLPKTARMRRPRHFDMNIKIHPSPLPTPGTPSPHRGPSTTLPTKTQYHLHQLIPTHFQRSACTVTLYTPPKKKQQKKTISCTHKNSSGHMLSPKYPSFIQVFFFSKFLIFSGI